MQSPARPLQLRLDNVLALFYAAVAMWTAAEDLCFCVKIGLRKGLARIRGMRRSLTEDEQEVIAKQIVEHLALSNWKIEAGRPLGGHGPSLIPKE